MAERVMKQDLIALDRDSTNRLTDEDGRLHIRVTNISKANICPYLGSEIPDNEKLGLDPKKVYKLLRDPEELRKAAPTFNNIQLLSEHVPVASDAAEPDAHRPMETVGSTGTDCVFDPPYLKNSIVVWSAPAIAGIESKEKRELSSSYRYDADMTPGVYNGQPYDGVMRNIRGNHVALVETGRAGSDVFAADAALQQENADMAKKLTRAALYASGAVGAYLSPKLAADAAMPSLASAFIGVTHANWKHRKPAIVAAIKKLAADKKLVLAKDADLNDISNFLDKLDGATSEVKEEEPGSKTAAAVKSLDPDNPNPPKEETRADVDSDPKDKIAPEMADADPDADPAAPDPAADPQAAVMEFLADKLSPEDMDHIKGLMNPSGQEEKPDAPDTSAMIDPPAEDDDDMYGSMSDDEKGAFDALDDDKKEDFKAQWAKDRKRAKDESGMSGASATTKTEGPALKPVTVTKTAMDAALVRVARETREATIAQMNGAAEARVKVMPIVGKLSAPAMDSAEKVFKFALDTAKVNTKGVHPSAYGAMVDILLREQKPARTIAQLAADAAKKPDEGLFKRFPTASFAKKA